MKLSSSILFLLVAFLLQVFVVTAQAKPVIPSDSTEKALFYGIALEFGSNKTYKGHIATPDKQGYFSPSIDVTSRWGVFATASAYRLLGDSARWDESDLSLGYETKLGKYKLSSSYTHSFFSKNTEQINSALTENVELYIKRPLFKILRTKLVFDYSFGDTTDFSITWQNSYPINWDDVFTADDEISLIPKFYLYYGTQNYYTRFYKLPKGQKILLKKSKNAQKLTAQDAQTDARFNLTGLYFTLPLSYTIGKFYFQAAPNYSVMLNQPKYEPKTPNTFSFTFTIGADF